MVDKIALPVVPVVLRRISLLVNEFPRPLPQLPYGVELVQRPLPARRRHTGVPCHGIVVTRDLGGPLLLPLEGLLQQSRLLQEQSVHVNLARRLPVSAGGDRFHGSIELVNDGYARGYRDVLNFVVTDLVDDLDQSPQSVGVRHHQHAPSQGQFAPYLVLPEWGGPAHTVQKRFRERNLLRGQIPVTSIPPRPVLVRSTDRRGPGAERTSPRLHKFVAELLCRLRLAQTSEGPIHALVEAPALEDGQVHLVQLLKEERRGTDGALQAGGEDNVNFKSTLQ
mmetsp:Transcript_28437/g.83635  ORF Transcript_28437/g.83635 Transcript_28437/m.83635 type:complete len:280 (+) Transcript_28437:1279-2118(+)